MKKIALLLAVLAFGYINAQTPTIQWQKALGGSEYEFAYDIKQTTDGGYIVAGASNSTNGDVTENHGGVDIWVVKLDVTGIIEWQKSLGGSGTDVAFSLQQTNDGGYIVAGYSNSTDGDVKGIYERGIDFWVVKLDAKGNLKWQKSLGGTGEDTAKSVQQTSDGGYIVAGYSDSNNGDVTGNHGKQDFWVVKLDVRGIVQWQKSLGGTDSDAAFGIQQCIDGGYIVAGNTGSTDGDVIENHGYLDNWVVKLDASGTLEWQKCFGGSDAEYANSVQQTADGGYVVVGFTNSTDGDVTGNKGLNDYWVIKLDTKGILQWQKCFGGSEAEFGYSIYQTMDEGYIVAGSAFSTDGDVTGVQSNFGDFWLIKLDAIGTLKWQKTLGCNDCNYASSVQQTTDGGFIVAGDTFSTNRDVTGNHGLSDFWVVKLSPEALDTESFLMNEIVIYPNPATATITIEAGNNTIIDKVIITDLMGKIILQETQNTKTIAIENWAQGMYLLNTYSGDQKMVSKFVKQ